MRIINEPLLDEFRSAGRCEACNARCWPTDAHHLMSRGAGRVDIRENVAALCRVCHTMAESNLCMKARVWARVCEREGVTEERIKELVWAMRRLPKRTPPLVVEAELERLRRLPKESA